MKHSFWLDRPVLVTGATGFLGSWLVKQLLESGGDIVCLIRDWIPQCELVRTGMIDRVSVVRGDVRDQAVLERVLGEYETDTVFHLAAQTIVGIAERNPISTFESNIQGTWALLEACRRSPGVHQIVVASSDKAYGTQEELPYHEAMSMQGHHPYAVSKSCADLIARTYAETYNLPVATTRCGNFFGGGDLNWNRIVPGTIRSILRGDRPIIRSDGRPIRDCIYVEDGAAAYILLAEKLATQPELAGEAFNFSSEFKIRVIELVKRILELMGSDLKPVVQDAVVGEILEQYLSTTKAREMLGWSPTYDMDTALTNTIAWYRKFLSDDNTSR